MRRVFRHVAVLTLAFALVASAAAWRQCTGLQLITAAASGIAHGPNATDHQEQTAGHGAHDHHAMHGQHASDDPVSPTSDDHGCMKCCAMCTVANVLPPGVDTAVTFTVSSRVFFREQELWTGNTVAVDPGIPKRIV